MSLLGELDTFADELDGERWHNAAKACRDAATEIERLRLENKQLTAVCEQWKNAYKLACEMGDGLKIETVKLQVALETALQETK